MNKNKTNTKAVEVENENIDSEEVRKRVSYEILKIFEKEQLSIKESQYILNGLLREGIRENSKIKINENELAT